MRKDSEAHGGLVFLKDVAWVLGTSHGTDEDTELRKECPPPRFYPYEIVMKKQGKQHEPQLEKWLWVLRSAEPGRDGTSSQPGPGSGCRANWYQRLESISLLISNLGQ